MFPGKFVDLQMGVIIKTWDYVGKNCSMTMCVFYIDEKLKKECIQR